MALFVVSVLFSISAFVHDRRTHSAHNTHAEDGGGGTTSRKLPHFALTPEMAEMSPGVYHMGSAYDWGHSAEVEGYAVVTYETSAARAPADTAAHGTGPCTSPFAEGTRWRVTEPFVVDHTNNQGLGEQFFLDAAWTAMCEWDSKLLFNIFGPRDNISVADGPDCVAPDGKNELMFCVIDEPGVLAITFLWGVFDGPVAQREMLETDVCFNTAFSWGNVSAGDSGVFDLQAVFTHEAGHCAGFGHVSLSEATMFASAGVGETKKRTLLECEIEGLCLHYDERETCPGHNSTGTVPPPFRAHATCPRPSAVLNVLLLLLLLSLLLYSINELH